MKFTIQRTQFTKYLSDVQRAISGKTTIPILTGVKLTLTDEGLTLTGSDVDISIELFIPTTDEKANLQIESTGTIVLQARFFSEIVKKLPEDTMTLEVLDHFQTKITSGKAEFTVNGLDANNYPQLPMVDATQGITIPVNVLKEIIGQTVIAVSTHESRPILTGVHMTIENQQLLAVATDSHRLSQRRIPIQSMEMSEDQKYQLIIPGKSLVELSRILDELHEDVNLYVTDNQVLFQADHLSFYSRLLEGNYPDTSRLIPTSASTEIEFSATTLLAAIDRASLLSHEGRNNVVKLVINDKDVKLLGNSPDVGNVEEDLAYQNVSGESLEISFNPDYMKDALRTFGPTNIKIEFTSAIRPFTLVPSEDQDKDFIQLITPVRTF